MVEGGGTPFFLNIVCFKNGFYLFLCGGGVFICKMRGGPGTMGPGGGPGAQKVRLATLASFKMLAKGTSWGKTGNPRQNGVSGPGTSSLRKFLTTGLQLGGVLFFDMQKTF